MRVHKVDKKNYLDNADLDKDWKENKIEDSYQGHTLSNYTILHTPCLHSDPFLLFFLEILIIIIQIVQRGLFWETMT